MTLTHPTNQVKVDALDYVNPQFLRLVEEVWSTLPRGSLEGGSATDPTSTPPELAATDADPLVIGRFEIRRELGRGGGGIVLLAFDPTLCRTVAMKVPAPEVLVSSAARRRFLSEAQAVAALRHPNIVAVHEAGEAGPIPYIIMDYCEGGSLSAWLSTRSSDHPVPPRWAARLVSQIAAGVQHAHDRGIIHRDLKPSNILLQGLPHDSPNEEAPESASDRDDPPEFVPMVTDFGLAKVSEGTGTPAGLNRTVEGLPLGTLPYMAAEAARGDGSAIGPATDVYGLGVILFELLTGRPPFAGSSQAALLHHVMHTAPPSPRDFRQDVPVDLETICLKCLQKDPRDRFTSPRELAQELQRFLDRSTIQTRPFPVRKPVRSRRRLYGVSVAVIALVVTFAGVSVAVGHWWVERQHQRATAVLLGRLEAAEVASLPELVPQVDPADRSVSERLTRLFAAGTEHQKLAASLVLATDGTEFGNYSYEQLLQAGPHQIEPIARLLDHRMPGLRARLKRDMELHPEAGPSTDAQDRRRANAACALIALGNGDDGWSLLRFAPDPQARSFLIHLLGPAGITPQRLIERIDAGGDASIRRALIQSLGAVPDAAWTADMRGRARTLLFKLYGSDPDPGVHGSAKWLLLRWNEDEALRKIDGQLSRSAQPPDRRWRISPMGLTFVTIDEPRTGRVIEVADSEVTVALFQRFRSDHIYAKQLSPRLNYPVNSITYALAAEFCNWLSEQEGIAPGQFAYRPGADSVLEPAEHQGDCNGYRLLTAQEFELSCRAGTTSARYHGASSTLLPEYAWCDRPQEMVMHPVCRLKPNDFGLFDTLGNADEICQDSRAVEGSKKHALLCGGSAAYREASIRCDLRRQGPAFGTTQRLLHGFYYFRVAAFGK